MGASSALLKGAADSIGHRTANGLSGRASDSLCCKGCHRSETPWHVLRLTEVGGAPATR